MIFRYRCPSCAHKIRASFARRKKRDAPWSGWSAGPFRCPECDVLLRFREPTMIEQILVWPLLVFSRGMLEIAEPTIPKARLETRAKRGDPAPVERDSAESTRGA